MRRVYLLWHGPWPVGICVLGFGPLSSSARNRLFGIRQKLTRRLARKINRNFTSVMRLVLDPRYRGAGVASAFLRRCCELTPWPWIELVSEMAALVPFCEAAGFRRVRRAHAERGSTIGSGPPARTSSTPWGKSNWTTEGFRAYARRVRFSKPAYFIFDNRR